MGRGALHPVEHLVSVRTNKLTGEREFKIRWKGYKPKDDSWVREKDLDGDATTFDLSPQVAKALGIEKGADKHVSNDQAGSSKRNPSTRRTRHRGQLQSIAESRTGSNEEYGENGHGAKGPAEEIAEDSDGASTGMLPRHLERHSSVNRKPSSFSAELEKRVKKSSMEVRRSQRLRLPRKRLSDEMAINFKKLGTKKIRKTPKPEKPKDEMREFWAVDRILGMRMHENVRELKIRWKGFSWRFDEWVKEEDLLEPLLDFPMASALKRRIKKEKSHNR